MATWQPASTAIEQNSDGRSFLFRVRNLATWEIMPPLVGRYHEGKLEWNNYGKWEEVGFPLVYWAEMPEMV